MDMSLGTTDDIISQNRQHKTTIKLRRGVTTGKTSLGLKRNFSGRKGFNNNLQTKRQYFVQQKIRQMKQRTKFNLKQRKWNQNRPATSYSNPRPFNRNQFAANPLAARLSPRGKPSYGNVRQFRARVGAMRVGFGGRPLGKPQFRKRQQTSALRTRLVRNNFGGRQKPNAQGTLVARRVAALRRAKVALQRAKQLVSAKVQGRLGVRQGFQRNQFQQSPRFQQQNIPNAKAQRMAEAMGLHQRAKLNRQSYLNQRRGFQQQQQQQLPRINRSTQRGGFSAQRGGFRGRGAGRGWSRGRGRGAGVAQVLSGHQVQFQPQQRRRWGRTYVPPTDDSVMSVTFHNSSLGAGDVQLDFDSAKAAVSPRGRAGRGRGRLRRQQPSARPAQTLQAMTIQRENQNAAFFHSPKSDTDPVLQEQIRQLKPTVKINYDMNAVNLYTNSTRLKLTERFGGSAPVKSEPEETRSIYI